MKLLAELFEQTFHVLPDSIDALPSSGSNRRYYRMTIGDRSAIGAIGCNPDENLAFFELDRHFRRNGIPVPEIYAFSDDRLRYIQEDLGNVTLFDAVAEGRKSGNYNDEERQLLKRAIAMLPTIQFCGGSGLDFNICYPIKEFDAMSIMFDLNYFKYCFLKTTGIEFDEVRLEYDFATLCNSLLIDCGDTFMYRDFQSRNIMVPDGELYFIDFQGGRRGPIYYDVASFILQARARYSKELRETLLDTYLESLSGFMRIKKKKHFLARFRQFALFRTLQVLGAYGFRGNYEHKSHFKESIPFAITNLESLLETPFEEYPYLNNVLVAVVEKYKSKTARTNEGRLHLDIFSFSYKSGIPEDESGNGGGYVFDCRGLPNPGRLEEFKHLTGLDQPVIDYIEEFPESEDFFKEVATLADSHIKNYIERGFTNLMFSFGCTGGRHRSVYFAQRLDDYLKDRYDIDITLNHRERGIIKEYPEK